MEKLLSVAFFAVGSAIKFNKKNILRSDGSSEYYATIKLLLKNKNIGQIVLLGRSDWGRLSPEKQREFDPINKIFDPYSQIKSISSRKKPVTIDEKRHYYMSFHQELEREGIKPDFGVGFTSQGWGTASLPGFLNTMKPPYKPVSCLEMTLYYASDCLYYLSKTNLKWFLLATDPRYVKPSMRFRDITNLPAKILGQQDFDINWFGIKEFKPGGSVENGDYMIRETKSYYSGIEKMNLINGGILNPEHNKPHKFTIVSMQLSPPSSETDLRFDILKEYILDRDKTQSARIFGKWNDFFKQGYPQFKGYIATEDLDKTFAETRYTLVLPTAAGWVTSKYAEMLQLGVVPFFHPKYDSQYHVVPKKHVLRIKSADDFYQKMDYFDANPTERIKLVKELQETLISSAHTGKFMIDLLNDSLSDVGTNYKLDDSEESLYTKREKTIINKQKMQLF